MSVYSRANKHLGKVPFRCFQNTRPCKVQRDCDATLLKMIDPGLVLHSVHYHILSLTNNSFPSNL